MIRRHGNNNVYDDTKRILVLGRDNMVAPEADNVFIQGDGNRVIGNVTNVTIMGGNNLTITQSDVTIVDGAPVNTNMVGGANSVYILPKYFDLDGARDFDLDSGAYFIGFRNNKHDKAYTSMVIPSDWLSGGRFRVVYTGDVKTNKEMRWTIDTLLTLDEGDYDPETTPDTFESDPITHAVICDSPATKYGRNSSAWIDLDVSEFRAGASMSIKLGRDAKHVDDDYAKTAYLVFIEFQYNY